MALSRSLLARSGAACFRCEASPEAGVSRCSRCRVAGYCGKECQAADFAEHKELCKALAVVLAEPFSSRTMQDWRNELGRRMADLDMYLGRELTVEEQQLMLWRPRCVVCFRSMGTALTAAASSSAAAAMRTAETKAAAGAAAPAPASAVTLQPCKRCRITWFCDQHGAHAPSQQAHALVCDELQMSVQIEQLQRSMFRSKETPVRVSQRPGQSFQPLPLPLSLADGAKSADPAPAAWKSYFESRLGLSLELAATAGDRKPAKSAAESDSKLTETAMRLFATSSSKAITALAALQFFYPERERDAKSVASGELKSAAASSSPLLPLPLPLSQRPSLTLHFVGAASLETHERLAYEELLHALPALRRLSTVFVGPDCPELERHSFEDRVCSECTKQGRSRHVSFHSQMYHVFAAAAAAAVVVAEPGAEPGSEPRSGPEPAGEAKTVSAAGTAAGDSKGEGSAALSSESSSARAHARARVAALDGVDLAVFCNSGLHEEGTDGWRPTVELIASCGVPCLFTSYNEHEAAADCAQVEQWGMTVLQRPARNPYRGLQPLREPFAERAFYFHNDWYFYAQGSGGQRS